MSASLFYRQQSVPLTYGTNGGKIFVVGIEHVLHLSPDVQCPVGIDVSVWHGQMVSNMVRVAGVPKSVLRGLRSDIAVGGYAGDYFLDGRNGVPQRQ